MLGKGDTDFYWMLDTRTYRYSSSAVGVMYAVRTVALAFALLFSVRVFIRTIRNTKTTCVHVRVHALLLTPHIIGYILHSMLLHTKTREKPLQQYRTLSLSAILSPSRLLCVVSVFSVPQLLLLAAVKTGGVGIPMSLGPPPG